MALANYSDLLASVASWMKRSDLTANIPDFVTLLEARVARDLRVRTMLQQTTLVCVSGTRNVALPSDWLEFDSVLVEGNPNRVLNYVTNQSIDTLYPENGVTSKPVAYTIVGSNMELGPVPDSAYNIPVTYYAKFPALESSSTNWLMTNHPSIYLFGTLVEASAFGFEDERVPMWEARVKADLESLKVADQNSNWSGSALRVRAVN